MSFKLEDLVTFQTFFRFHDSTRKLFLIFLTTFLCCHNIFCQGVGSEEQEEPNSEIVATQRDELSIKTHTILFDNLSVPPFYDSKITIPDSVISLHIIDSVSGLIKYYLKFFPNDIVFSNNIWKCDLNLQRTFFKGKTFFRHNIFDKKFYLDRSILDDIFLLEDFRGSFISLSKSTFRNECTLLSDTCKWVQYYNDSFSVMQHIYCKIDTFLISNSTGSYYQQGNKINFLQFAVINSPSVESYRNSFHDLEVLESKIASLEFSSDTIENISLNNDTLTNLIFTNCHLKKTLYLNSNYFNNNGVIEFMNTILPDSIFLYNNYGISRDMDFTYARFDSSRIDPITKKYKRHLLLIFEKDLSKIKIDYVHFKLYFDDNPSSPYNLTNDDRRSVYEGFLKNFYDRGLKESFQALDIEYQDFKWRKSWFPLGSLLNKYWWNYGYDKEYVFVWIFALITVFTLVNFFGLRYLQFNVYAVENISVPSKKRFMLRLWYAFIYTSAIFFKLSLKLEKLNFHNKLGSLFVIIIYSSGIICLAYLANFILK